MGTVVHLYRDGLLIRRLDGRDKVAWSDLAATEWDGKEDPAAAEPREHRAARGVRGGEPRDRDRALKFRARPRKFPAKLRVMSYNPRITRWGQKIRRPMRQGRRRPYLWRVPPRERGGDPVPSGESIRRLLS